MCHNGVVDALSTQLAAHVAGAEAERLNGPLYRVLALAGAACQVPPVGAWTGKEGSASITQLGQRPATGQGIWSVKGHPHSVWVCS